MMRGRALIQAGQGRHPSLRRASLTVAVTITDLEALLADPLDPANVSGLVTIAGLTSARGASVATGAPHLLARAGRDGQRAMIYRLPFTGFDGQQWVLHGSKDIWRRRGLDIWQAATTLHATAASPGGPGPSAAQAAVSHRREIP